MQPKPQIQCTLEIPKNPLNQVEMRFPRSMHVEAGLLHCMSNIRMRQCEILKGACKAAVLSGIRDERTVISCKFATGVYGSRTRVALQHTGALQEVDGVLALGQHHP